MRNVLKSLAMIGALMLPSALAAQDYPGSQPVRIIVPSGPGASNDTFARFLADKLTQKWGTSVVVENMPGAGGSIGFAALAQSPPDGHTLVLFSSSLATNAAAQSNLPFDSEKDILPVAKFADGQLILVGSNRLGIKSIEDLVREGKAQKIFVAGLGQSSMSSFVGLQAVDVLGIQGELVQYKSGGEALIDIAGDRADLYVGTISTVLPALEKGSAVPLAVLQAERAEQLPDVPSIAELGFPDGASTIWNGVFAPGGTPDAIVEKLNADINEVLAMPDTIEMLEKNGSSPAIMSAAEFQAYVKDELVKWRAIADKFGLRS